MFVVCVVAFCIIPVLIFQHRCHKKLLKPIEKHGRITLLMALEISWIGQKVVKPMGKQEKRPLASAHGH